MFQKHFFQWSIPAILETISKSIVLVVSIIFLEKIEFGIITAAMLIFTYHPFLSLGITDGLMIKLPGYYIKNRTKDIISTLSISRIYIILVISFLFLITLIFYIFFDSNLFLYVALIYGLSTIPYQYYYHYLLLNRFTYSFDVTQKSRLLIVFVRLFVQIPLLIKFGLMGVIFGELIVYSLAALYIRYLSKLNLLLYFDKSLFKKILFFGLPILFVNLFGTLAATMEKLVSSIFLDFESIANVGALTFIGSIFLIISSQLLSLFSQYSREFIVEKPKQTKILFRSYIAFTHFSVVVYILFCAILFSTLEKYIIPVFAKNYYEIIVLFPIIFVLFYLRIFIASMINFLLILGERTKIALSHFLLIFSSSVAIFINTFINEINFSINTFLISITFGAITQLIFCLYISNKIVKTNIESVWISFSTILFILFGLSMYIEIFDNWIIYGTIFSILFAIVQFWFLNLKKLSMVMTDLISLLKKEYL